MDLGNWVAIDKRIVSLLPTNRRFTISDALLSVSVDIDNIIYKWTQKGKGTTKIPETPEEAINLLLARVSIAAYASRWGWSRNKTTKFIRELGMSSGHVADKRGTGKGHPIRLIINNLHMVADRKGTGKGQVADTSSYPLSLNLNPKTKSTASSTHTRMFTPPSLDEVSAYCQERNNHVDAQRWLDHYEAVGWLVGKKKMVDWKAAVRTWEKSDLGGNNEKRDYSRGNTGQGYRTESAAKKFGDWKAYPCDLEVSE